MQLEIDLAEYLLNHPELTSDCQDSARQLVISNDQAINFKDEFDSQYQDLLLYLIRNELSYRFPLNSEDATVIITKDFIEQLLGKDYFKYEYKN